MLLCGEVAPTATMGQHGRYKAIVGGVAVRLAEERLKLLGFLLEPLPPSTAQPKCDAADHGGIFGQAAFSATQQWLQSYFEDRSSIVQISSRSCGSTYFAREMAPHFWHRNPTSISWSEIIGSQGLRWSARLQG